MARAVALHITGLHLTEFYELEERFPDLEQLDRDKELESDFGTPELVAAVITLTAAVLPLLTTWLTDRRARTTHRTGLTVEVKPDGTVVAHLQPLALGTAASAVASDPAAVAAEIRAALAPFVDRAGSPRSDDETHS